MIRLLAATIVTAATAIIVTGGAVIAGRSVVPGISAVAVRACKAGAYGETEDAGAKRATVAVAITATIAAAVSVAAAAIPASVIAATAVERTTAATMEACGVSGRGRHAGKRKRRNSADRNLLKHHNTS